MSGRYAFFPGCKIPAYSPYYAQATEAVLKALGIELDKPEFNCCGYSMRNLYFEASVVASARAMAIAEARGLDILTPCMCCYGNLRRAKVLFEENPSLKAEANKVLAEEGLEYTGEGEIVHLFRVLYDEIGTERLSELAVKPLEGLKVAALYGCHGLRPSKVTRLDHPWQPTIVDELLKATGAEPVDWPGKALCCGSVVRETNEKLSFEMITSRLREARQAGAQVLCISCPHSLMQAGWAYSVIGTGDGLVQATAVYPQLLGLAMGMDPAELGVDQQLLELVG